MRHLVAPWRAVRLLISAIVVCCVALPAACSSSTGSPEAENAGGSGAAPGGTSAGAAGVGAGSAAIPGSGGAPNGSAGAVVGGGAAGLGPAGTAGLSPSAGGFASAGGAGSGSSGSGGSFAAGGASMGGSLANGGSPGVAGTSSAGGAAGASGAAGSGGASGYSPCPTNGDPCKILPLGDSITWGAQYDGAYRVELFTKAVGDRKKITFTGSLSNGPTTVAGQPFPKNNEGHSGWTIDQDAGLVPHPAFDVIPHIVLLHIGTNDVYAQGGGQGMASRLGSLVDKITAAAPSALVAVAKIIPLANTGANATIKTYNDAIPGLIQARANMGKHVIVVDLNTGFTPAMLSGDGIHPNKSGYDFMGDKWYATISSLLP